MFFTSPKYLNVLEVYQLEIYKLYETFRFMFRNFNKTFLIFLEDFDEMINLFMCITHISIFFIFYKVEKLKQMQKNDTIFLCKYHKQYKVSYKVDKNICQAMKRNGYRCNQICG